MMRILFLLFFCLFLGACSSPALQMSAEQIRTLSDDQLCSYKNSYAAEPKTELEIAKRKLNCNPFHRACLKQGLEPSSKGFEVCMHLMQENQRLQRNLELSEFKDWQRDMDRLHRLPYIPKTP
jgi:hypothetical protein